ncbi:MAG: hypothetical protein ACKO3T_13560 [Planctomycetaceae bacterium]
MTDFYSGSPLDPDDLWFRDDFIDQLWDILQTENVILSAPRRTGKTSVMDHLAARPRHGFTAIPVFVQDLDHPSEFLLTLLDAFHARQPSLFRSLFYAASDWLRPLLDRFEGVEVPGFKVALREKLGPKPDAWKDFGDLNFFAVVRKSEQKLLFIVDEFPDLILNMARNHPELVSPFLAWHRGHCLRPRPRQDNIRWLLGGSVNLSSTLDSLGNIDLINQFRDVSLPILTRAQLQEFVQRMLSERNVPFDPQVPCAVAEVLGRPVPYFLQMITQNLYRLWRRERRELVVADVRDCFNELVISSAARDKLQHFYSRIQAYYTEPRRSAAYTLLAALSLSPNGLPRTTLQQKFEVVLEAAGIKEPEHRRKQLFNQLLRDLENDFYIAEVSAEAERDSLYDFSSGLLKAWWYKYYA